MSAKTRGIRSLRWQLPFLDGRRIASVYGERCTDWFTEIYGGSGETDDVG